MSPKTSSTSLPPPSAEERRLSSLTGAFGEEQFAILRKLLPQLFPAIQAQLGLDDTGAYDAADRSLVGQFAEESLGLGESDINRQLEESLQMVRDELAPSRGLRPTDTPIQDAGFGLAEEAVRQKGQLSRGVRAQQAQSLLGLRERAAQNRLALFGGMTDPYRGLELLQRPRLASPTTKERGFGLGEIGQLASGIGAAKLAFASSRSIKVERGNVDAVEVLEKLRGLPLKRWSYRGETTEHLGPYAEDFKELFGVGDGKTIHLVDVMGVLLAAMKGLEARG